MTLEFLHFQFATVTVLLSVMACVDQFVLQIGCRWVKNIIFLILFFNPVLAKMK